MPHLLLLRCGSRRPLHCCCLPPLLLPAAAAAGGGSSNPHMLGLGCRHVCGNCRCLAAFTCLLCQHNSRAMESINTTAAVQAPPPRALMTAPRCRCQASTETCSTPDGNTSGLHATPDGNTSGQPATPDGAGPAASDGNTRPTGWMNNTAYILWRVEV